MRQQSTVGSLLLIFRSLPRSRQIHFSCLIFLMLASGAAELLSLSSVLAFFQLLESPQAAPSNRIINVLLNYISYTNRDDLILKLSIAFCLIFFLTGLIRLLTLRANTHLSSRIGTDISKQCFTSFLSLNYLEHKEQLSADLNTTFAFRITRTVSSFGQLLQIATSSVICIFIIAGLLLVDYKICLISTGLFAFTYVLLVVVNKPIVSANGKLISHNQKESFRILSAANTQYKNIVLESSQDRYLSNYMSYDFPIRRLIANNQFLSLYPKSIIETLLMICLALGAAYLTVSTKETNHSTFALLWTFAVGAQRLIPSFQQIYTSLSIIQGYKSDLISLSSLVTKAKPLRRKTARNFINLKSIVLSDLSYRYPDQPEFTLTTINATIKPGSKVAIIGKTGSGKSTLIDMIMGFLPPTGGELIVNNCDIYDPDYFNLKNDWMYSITHLSQKGFLFDGTILENITLESQSQVDWERLESALKNTCIYSFIQSLPDRYQFLLSENGGNISGGQAQRILLARTLYRDSPIIVLDEPTSALDKATEQEVLFNISSNYPDKTIIVVTHSASCMHIYDSIFSLRDKRLSALTPPGSYT